MKTDPFRRFGVLTFRRFCFHPFIPALLAAALSLSAGHAEAASRLLELIGDDAIGALYVDRPQRALPPALTEPLLNAFAPDAKAGRLCLAAFKRLPGPVMIGLLAPRKGQDDLAFFAAMELRGRDVEVDALLSQAFLPAINAMLKREGTRGLRLEQGKTVGRVVDGSGGETVFAYAIKEGLVFGSTRPQCVMRWRRGEYPARRWVDMPGVRKMLGGLPKTFSVRGVFNTASVSRLIGKPKPNSITELMLKVLAPEEFRAAALDLAWERASLRARLTVALADGCEGIARVLTRPATSARSLGVFPDDFQVLGRIGWNKASDVVAGAYALCDRFDETISAEYREELAELRRDCGVDWDRDILGNLVGEVAIGVRVDFTRRTPISWAAVLPLDDEATFRRQFEKLVATFDLAFESSEIDGLHVRRAVETVPFSLAIQGGHLILGGDSETVAELANRAAQAKRNNPAGRNLRACYTALGDPNQMVVMLDVEGLRRKVPILPLVLGTEFAPLFAQGHVGAAMTVEDRSARLDFRWSFVSPGAEGVRRAEDAGLAVPGGEEAMAALATVLVKSVAGARRQAQQVISMSNMRGLGQACYIYAERHKGAFPDSLEELVKSAPDLALLESLTSPYDGRGPKSIEEVGIKSYVVYRPGFTTASPPLEVILAERHVREGHGACFLFVDSHVEFVPEPRASELLVLMAAGAPEVRP